MSEKIRIKKTVDEWIKTISAEIQVDFGKKNRINSQEIILFPIYKYILILKIFLIYNSTYNS